MARRYRPRKLFKFWLYCDIEIEARMIDYIDYLHQTRQFATTVRNGLRLMWTLGEGDLSVLFELFPTLQAKLIPDNSALIEEFKALLQKQQPAMALSAPTTPGGIKQLPAHQIEMPVFDDEDTFIIRQDTHSSENTTDNFLEAAFGFQKKKDN